MDSTSGSSLARPKGSCPQTRPPPNSREPLSLCPLSASQSLALTRALLMGPALPGAGPCCERKASEHAAHTRSLPAPRTGGCLTSTRSTYCRRAARRPTNAGPRALLRQARLRSPSRRTWLRSAQTLHEGPLLGCRLDMVGVAHARRALPPFSSPTASGSSAEFPRLA